MHPEPFGLLAITAGCLSALLAASIWARSAEHGQRIGLGVAALVSFIAAPIIVAALMGRAEVLFYLCMGLAAGIIAAPCGLLFGTLGWGFRNRLGRRNRDSS
jgi:hypothetical protein